MKQFLINLLLLLGGLVTGLVICEGGIRLIGVFSPAVAFLSSIGKETPARFANTLEDYVKTPEFLLHPHGKYIGCKTNSFGFNDEEFNDNNTETIAIGDSFLFGRVAYSDNFVTKLEAELQRHCGLDKRFPISNFGIAGLQPRDYLEVLRLVLKKYRPKTILLHLYLGNDFPQIAHLDRLEKGVPKKENLVSRYFTSQIVLFRFFNNLKRFLLSDANQPKIEVAKLEDLNKEAGSCLPISDAEQKFLAKPSFSSAEWFKIVAIEAGRFYSGGESVEELTKMRLNLVEPLKEMVRLCKERNIRLIAMLSPSQLPLRPDLRNWFFQISALEGYLLREQNFDWDLPSRLTAKILSTLGIEHVDITPYLGDKMRSNPETPYYALADTHWNENGNRAAAEIAGNLLKPLLCPR